MARWEAQAGLADLETTLTPAIQWLIGLDNDKTPDANARTLAWLKEWQAKQEGTLS